MNLIAIGFGIVLVGVKLDRVKHVYGILSLEWGRISFNIVMAPHFNLSTIVQNGDWACPVILSGRARSYNSLNKKKDVQLRFLKSLSLNFKRTCKEF